MPLLYANRLSCPRWNERSLYWSIAYVRSILLYLYADIAQVSMYSSHQVLFWPRPLWPRPPLQRFLSPRPVSQSLLSLCLFPPGLFPMSIFKSKHPFMSQHLRIYPVLSCHYLWRPYFLSSRHIILKVLVWFFHPPSPKSMFLIKLKSAYNE